MCQLILNSFYFYDFFVKSLLNLWFALAMRSDKKKYFDCKQKCMVTCYNRSTYSIYIIYLSIIYYYYCCPHIEIVRWIEIRIKCESKGNISLIRSRSSPHIGINLKCGQIKIVHTYIPIYIPLYVYMYILYKYLWKGKYIWTHLCIQILATRFKKLTQ